MREDTSQNAEKYLSLALQKQSEKAISFLDELADSKKLSLMDLCDILVAAQQQTSCAPKGVITFADEHYRSDVTLRAIDTLSKKFSPSRGKEGGSALVANLLQREHHTVGIKMFAAILKANGWKVDFVASPLDVTSFFKRIEKSSEKFNLICFTVTMEFNVEELARILKTLRTNANTRDAIIVVGSRLFSAKSFIDKMTDKETGRPLADFIAKDFTEGLKFIRDNKTLQRRN